MNVTVTYTDVAIRLAATVLAGAAIGLNRGEHGRPAGLRTTMLVCLAASVAMIQANFLLGTVGKAPNSFVNLDTMRLPLGILSGIGFIGGGAILKRGNMVMGVTTAATLWFVTVIGLCFGGGQLILGGSATVLALVVLWGLKKLENIIPRTHRGWLSVTLEHSAASEKMLQETIAQSGSHILSWGLALSTTDGTEQFRGELEWKGKSATALGPYFREHLTGISGIKNFEWTPQSIDFG